MKTRYLILAVLLIFSVSTTTKAGSTDKTISHRFPGGYWSTLSCDGAVIDEIWGSVDVHCVMHYENGVIVWMTMRYTGSVTSSNTGEVFEIKSIEKYNLPQPGIIIFHFNLKGNQGSHILNSGTINPSTWEITVDKSICN